MDTCKLKIKIGPHEFEAEGPTEIVQEQFHGVQRVGRECTFAIPSEGTHDRRNRPCRNRPKSDEIDQKLEEIMKVEDRVVSPAGQARQG